MNDTLQGKVSFIQMRNLTQYLFFNLGFFFFFFFFLLSLSCFLRICARSLARASFLPFTFLRAQGRRWRSTRARKTSSRLIGRNRNCSVRARVDGSCIFLVSGPLLSFEPFLVLEKLCCGPRDDVFRTYCFELACYCISMLFHTCALSVSLSLSVSLCLCCCCFAYGTGFVASAFFPFDGLFKSIHAGCRRS